METIAHLSKSSILTFSKNKSLILHQKNHKIQDFYHQIPLILHKIHKIHKIHGILKEKGEARGPDHGCRGLRANSIC